MCGIAGIYLKNKKLKLGTRQIEAFCDRLLIEIEPRGRHATGFLAVGWDSSIVLDKADVPAIQFIKDRERFQKDVQTVLLHTRFETKGTCKVMGNNHPVSSNTCWTIHNGSISNDDELFEKEKMERKFEVDSEAIPALLDHHGLDTPDSIREALEKLEGAMAIATVDPVKHPGKLLLAKGADSPLYIFENNNVIVWASTHGAIKDTWGDLVGTPPQTNKIKYVGEGHFYIAQDYQDLGEYEFKPKKRPYYRAPQSGNHYGRGNRGHLHTPTPLARNVGRKPWDSEGPFNTIQDFKDAVVAYRKRDDLEGPRVRLWSLRDTYDTKTDFEDCNGVLRWPTCICGDAPLHEDMQKHLKYGLICRDCYKVIFDKWGEKADEDPLKNISIPTIPELDRRNLENWSRTEATLHRYTLGDLSEESGYSIQALDFLLFRTVGTAGDFGAGMVTLKLALKRAYDKLEEEIRMNYWSELQEEVVQDALVTEEAAQEIANESMHPWTAYTEGQRVMYVCEIHGERFHYGEHCGACVWNDYEDEKEANGDQGSCGAGSEDKPEACGIKVWADDVSTRDSLDSPLELCSVCKQWMLDVCVHCSKAGTEPEDKFEVTETACCCKSTRDRRCRRKLVIVTMLALLGAQKGYCQQHWNKCSAPKCALEANFTALDGQRYCHKDSRRKQGIADVAAMKNDSDMMIVEVK